MKTNEGGRGARSSWRLYPAFTLTVVLAGCAAQSGPPLSALATVGGPPKGMARIVVVRPEKGYKFAIGDRDFPVKLDGQPLGELATGTFAYLDRPAGSHQLSAEFWDTPGVTRRDFTAVSGRIYYFRASLHEKVNDIRAVTMISPLGGVIASAATYDDRQGPINLTPISESEAKQAITATQ
jgi:Protein of unknown function (DUF2846)